MPDSLSDHDLLIRLDVKVQSLREEVRVIGDGIVLKVKSDMALALQIVDQAKEEAKRVALDVKDGYDDHEARIRRNEKSIAIATGGLIMAQILTVYLLK